MAATGVGGFQSLNSADTVSVSQSVSTSHSSAQKKEVGTNSWIREYRRRDSNLRVPESVNSS
jgi:hypothetical protein